MKRAIVTGATGFIGLYLVDELLKKNYEVYSVVRSSNINAIGLLNQQVHIIYCDMETIDALPTIIKDTGFDIFYHLAWEGNSGDRRGDYSLQLRNAESAGKAAVAAGKMGCKRFICAGSITQLMYRDYLVTDEAVPDMVACYAIGKIAAEYISRCVCNRDGVDYIWPYISNFYGVGDTTNNLINFVADSYMKGISPNLTAGEQLADFIYVSDVASALVALGEYGKDKSTYYVGYGKPRPLKEFVKIIHRTFNTNVDTGLGKKAFNGNNIEFDKLDMMKLNRDTGFLPAVSFEDGIQRYLDWRNSNMMKELPKVKWGGKIGCISLHSANCSERLVA